VGLELRLKCVEGDEGFELQGVGFGVNLMEMKRNGLKSGSKKSRIANLSVDGA
jgi:hypothetical protein